MSLFSSTSYNISRTIKYTTNIINMTASIGIATIDKAKMAIINTVNPVVPAISLRFFGNFIIVK